MGPKLGSKNESEIETEKTQKLYRKKRAQNELKIATEMSTKLGRKTCQKHENLCKYTYKNSITHSLLFTRKMLRFRIFSRLKI